ncbi:MAG: hypothetical protein ACRERV_07035 [Methylococcales bacterium]
MINQAVCLAGNSAFCGMHAARESGLTPRAKVGQSGWRTYSRTEFLEQRARMSDELNRVDSEPVENLGLLSLDSSIGCAERSEAHQSRTVRLLTSAASYKLAHLIALQSMD